MSQRTIEGLRSLYGSFLWRARCDASKRSPVYLPKSAWASGDGWHFLWHPGAFLPFRRAQAWAALMLTRLVGLRHREEAALPAGCWPATEVAGATAAVPQGRPRGTTGADVPEAGQRAIPSRLCQPGSSPARGPPPSGSAVRRADRAGGVVRVRCLQEAGVVVAGARALPAIYHTPSSPPEKSTQQRKKMAS